jgi:hypothetical protein
MFSKVLVTSALCAVAFASPFLPYSPGAAERPAEMKVLSDYFSMLGQKVQAGRQMSQAPVCNMANAVLPVACRYHVWIDYPASRLLNSSSSDTSPGRVRWT